MFFSHVVLTKAHSLAVGRQCPFFTDTDRYLPVLLCFSHLLGFHSLFMLSLFCFGDTGFCKFVLALFILFHGL